MSQSTDYPDLGGFDYLVQMPVSSLTKERRVQLEADASEKALELEVLRATAPVDMWIKELDELWDAIVYIVKCDHM